MKMMYKLDVEDGMREGMSLFIGLSRAALTT